jgi:hypothetical protein
MSIKPGLYRIKNKVVRVVEVGPGHKKVKVDWGNNRKSWVSSDILTDY